MAGTNNNSSKTKRPPRPSTLAATNWGGRTNNSQDNNTSLAAGAAWSDAITAVFEVEKLLGAGGMGKVHLLRNKNTGRRFAVKRPISLTNANRHMFLEELLVWSDLPEHPNLTRFDSFQIIDDEILIFTEYVEGGSLQKWISKRKLYKGSKKQVLARILDTAIQFAWGLSCIHELGLIHRDVKTANVLLSEDSEATVRGVKASVADYGLAQARSNAESKKIYTAEYCSPEQAAGNRLDQATDVWSWGISVLEIFMGKSPARYIDLPGDPRQPSGTRAAAYLEAFLKHNGKGRGIPIIPDGVAKLLKSCFQNDQKLRVSMKVAVEKLKKVYRNQIGARYPRRLTTVTQNTRRASKDSERRTYHWLSWDDPIEWLGKALSEKGELPTKAEFLARYGNMRRGKSRRAELAFDIAVADEARVIYKDLVNTGRIDLNDSLAHLCEQAAHIHLTAGASSGALALYDQAIKIYEQMQDHDCRPDLAASLAVVYQYKANALKDLKDYRSAVILYKKSIKLLERLVDIEHRAELVPFLATAYQNLAVTRTATKDQQAATILYDKAIKLLERLANVDQKYDLTKTLAVAYQNKAYMLALFKNHQAAVVLYDKTIKITKQMIAIKSRPELREFLATTHTNKAVSLAYLKNYRAAVFSYCKAIEILEKLVNVENRTELASILAITYQNTANALTSAKKNYQTALELCIKSTDILKQLVYVENRAELEDSLAMAYQNMGKALICKKCYLSSIAAYSLAIDILERLVNTENRKELADDLALTYENIGEALSQMKDHIGAEASHYKLIRLLKGIMTSQNRVEQAMDLLELGLKKARG